MGHSVAVMFTCMGAIRKGFFLLVLITSNRFLQRIEFEGEDDCEVPGWEKQQQDKQGKQLS